MITTAVPLILFASLVGARAIKRQESELFINLDDRGSESNSVSQCDDVEFGFGGGVPPYTLRVWSASQQAFTSEFHTDTEGTGIWSIQSDPTSLALYLGDSGGASVQSPLLEVVTGTDSCYAVTPVLRLTDQAATPTISQSSGGDPPKTSDISFPQSTQTPPSLSSASLEDCRPNGPAACKFTASSQSGIYSQQTLIGNVFANCHSTQPVKQTFTGSTTITDNWSVSVGPTFEVPVAQLSVVAQVSRQVARTVTQTFEWNIEPGKQTALVAVGKFNGIFGGMDLSYSNGSRARLEGAVYFQSTGEAATVTRLDIDCGDSWPRWNATTESNRATKLNHCGSYELWLIALILLTVIHS